MCKNGGSFRLPRQPDAPHEMTNVERAVKALQVNLVVISEPEKRQSELLKIHSQRLGLLEVGERRVSSADGQRPRPYCN